jgi:hypothetical protein
MLKIMTLAKNPKKPTYLIYNMGTMRRSRRGRRSTRRGGAASLPPLPASPPNSVATSAAGNAGSKESCVALLRRLLPDEYDFQRMMDNEYANVQGKTYKQFIQGNVSTVYAMSEAECVFHKALFERILRGTVRTMDMEYASANGASNVFFDAKGRVVVVTPR